MAYDVFLASALADRDMAKLIARRLRALKFKVWFDQKQTDDTLDPKDARNLSNSQSVVVLWSGAAAESDFVRAAASIAHSRPGTLLQAGLDDVEPYEPFKVDERFVIEGMTSRTTPEGFYALVEELGRRDGRSDLRQWLEYGPADENRKAAWLSAHPTDPLALAAEKARQRKLSAKPAPAAAAAGAAALAASSLKSARPAATSGMAAGASGASAASAGPAGKAGAASAGAARPRAAANDDIAGGPIPFGWGLLFWVLAGIAAMLLLAAAMRSRTLAPSASPAVANAMVMAPVCPPGEAPAALLAPPILETGPIIDDTSDEAE